MVVEEGIGEQNARDGKEETVPGAGGHGFFGGSGATGSTKGTHEGA